MGSSNMTSAYGPVENPWKRRQDDDRRAGAGRLVRRLGGGGGGAAGDGRDRHRYRRLDPPAGVVLRHSSGVKPTYGRCSRWGIVAFASSLDQAGPFARTVRGLRDPAAARWPGTTRRIPPAPIVPVPDFEAACARGVKGLRIGMPQEYRVRRHAGGDRGAVAAGRGLAARRRAPRSSTSRCRTRNTRWRPTTSSRRPRRRPTSRAMTACASACACDGEDLRDLYERTRAAGFGAEVRRRILIGTYVLSAGYYDAYYLKAQKVRALILRDFTEAFAQGRCAADADRAVGGVRAGREDGRSDHDVSERRVHRAGQSGGRAGHLGAGRARRATACRWACR